MPSGTDFFAGREEVLASLRAQLTPGNGRAAVLSGMGGIGKTQTAIEYARRHQSDYSIILWCLADSEPSLTSGFAAFAPDLGLPEKNDVPELVRDVKRWLERHQNWLLVLDNADDPALAKQFLPGHHKGSVLLTSVASDFSIFGVVNPDELDVLTETEAMNFFRARFGRDFSEAERAELANLAEELGHFPLALEQAAAYLRATKTPVAKYLADLKSRGLPVLEKGRVTATDYRKTVATTWRVAFEIIERDHPVSAEVLRLSAFLAPDKIPVELFDTLAPEGGTANDLVALLMRFSLVRFDGKNQTFNVHRLVQDVTKFRLSEDAKRELIKRGIELVCCKFPDPQFENWLICRRLLTQAEGCAISIGALGFEDAISALLVNRVGYFLLEEARYDDAKQLLEMAIRISEQLFGSEHSNTANSLENLAFLYDAQGLFKDAEKLFVEVLKIRKKIFGVEHPETADSFSNLASLYNVQGRYDEAKPLLEKALEIYERVYGDNHSNTATILDTLAGLHRSQGRFSEAEQLYGRALEINEKLLGTEHPDTAVTLNNLAGLYRSQGRYAEAESVYKRAVEVYERVFGTEHPETAGSLNNLALLYQSTGRYTEAEQLYWRALKVRERMLGAEHPATAGSLENLGVLFRLQKRYAEAEPFYRRSIEIMEKVWGVEHPNMATSLNNLAMLYHSQGKYAEAESMLEQVVQITETALGSEHPDTAESLSSLAGLYRGQGRYTESEPLFKRALVILERTLGAEHPSISVSLNNLAGLYESQDQYAEAEPLYERALTILQKSLGDEHPNTKTVASNLEALRRKMNGEPSA